MIMMIMIMIIMIIIIMMMSSRGTHLSELHISSSSRKCWQEKDWVPVGLSTRLAGADPEWNNLVCYVVLFVYACVCLRVVSRLKFVAAVFV